MKQYKFVKKLYRNKEIFIKTVAAAVIFSLFLQENYGEENLKYKKETVSFYDIFKESGSEKISDLNHELEENQFYDVKNMWLPDFSFSLSGSVESGFDREPEDYCFSPTLSVSQKIPGGITVEGKILHSMSLYKSMYKDEDFTHSYSFSPSLSVRVPLIFNQEMARKNFSANSKYRGAVFNYLNLKFQSEKMENLADFIEYAGQFLYCREISQILEEKRQLYVKQEEYYDYLISVGKASVQQRTEKMEKTFEILEDISDFQVSGLAARRKLIQAGMEKNPEKTFLGAEFETFVDYVNEEVLFMDLQEFSDETNLALLEKNYYADFVSNVNKLPSFSAGFTVSPDAEEFGNFQDFGKASWSGSLSVTIPFFTGESFWNVIKNQKLSDRIYRIQKSNIQKQIDDRENQLGEIKRIYGNYVEKMKRLSDNEAERVEAVKKLLELGKVSEMDLDLQINSMKLAQCYYRKARFDYCLNVLKFY